MIEDIKTAKELAAEWQKLITDRDRLKFIQSNRNNLMVHLDNDESHVGFIYNDDELTEEEEQILDELQSEMDSFNQYFGCNDGILMLFEMLNIRAEEV